MTKRPQGLPDFGEPPITEMHMKVQFEPLPCVPMDSETTALRK